jgi:EAL domain-containing protein (putative c-di-GMP-specific phosphodiesterase class I)
VIQELKSFGLMIHLDNFGRGHSSLVYFSQLPFDAIKIDRYFISEFQDPGVRGILKSLVSMGQDLRTKVIAKGVETQEQRDYLQTIGCNYSQGYFFAAGLDPMDFENRYLNQEAPVESTRQKRLGK